MTREIPLTKGKVALIDDCDFERVGALSWYATRNAAGIWYAERTEGRGKGRSRSMHRFIMGDPLGLDVDHWNRDGLDNRRSNLRVSTRSQNLCNARKRLIFAERPTSSRFKGVSLRCDTGKWQVFIRINKARVTVGCFSDEVEAARAYDEAALLHYGEFARLNFPKE